MAEPKNYNLNEAKIDETSVGNFLNDYLRLYSGHSNVRGIPFIGDGFKEAQRKAMWGMFKKPDVANVERKASACAELTDYHHGDGSMQGTIIKLAQDFAGSNNMNLLVPDGQFGSRLSHGAAAPRYIFTTLHENFRKLFRPEDDVILEQIEVNGSKLEPKFFIPLLPMTLVNGAEGMGTGHATHIFQYSPKALRDAIYQLLAGKKFNQLKQLVPAWRDFKGKVSKDPVSGQVVVTGILDIVNTTQIRITELPVGVQIDQYKEVLFKLEDKEIIKNFESRSDRTGFDFIVNVPRMTGYKTREELIKIFKLESRDTENFTLWDKNGVIKKFVSAEEVLAEFVEWRLEQYERRRLKLIELIQIEIKWLEEVIRFINFFLKNTELFRNTGKAALIKLLTDEKFAEPERLLNLSIWNLTKDRIDEITEKLTKERTELSRLQATNPVEMYTRELKELKLDF